MNAGRLVAAMFAILGVVGASCSAADDQPVTKAAESSAAIDNLGQDDPATPVTAIDAPFFERGPVDEVFVLAEGQGELMEVGYAGSLEDPVLLVAGTQAAVPDGHSGVVFVAEDEVWWKSDEGAEPELIESPGQSVNLVGLRWFLGEPMAVVLIGDKLVGYDRGVNELLYAFTEFGGAITDLDVDAAIAVAIVDTADGAAVQRVDLSSGESRELMPPVDGGDPNAPLAIAISDGRIAILRESSGVSVIDIDGAPIGEVTLGVPSESITSFDLAGPDLLVAFGESATSTDLTTGDRHTVRYPLGGWVLGAVWAPTPDFVDSSDGTDLGRYRVDAVAVLADVADPFLNVRHSPDASSGLLSKLPPDYHGLRWTGEDSRTESGAVWYEVELLDPVAITPLDPLERSLPSGWVNSRYLVPLSDGLPVGRDEAPACDPAGSGFVDSSGDGGGDDDQQLHVYAIESVLVSSRCLRTVITFGSGEAPIGWHDVEPSLAIAKAVPEAYVMRSGSWGVDVVLGEVASVWPGATETPDGVFVVRTGGSLRLLSPRPVDRASITTFHDQGLLVIDMVLSDDQVSPARDANVVLTQPPWARTAGIEIVGIARPFEANLGVHVESANEEETSGLPVKALYSGSLAFGTIRTERYAVQTEDWLSTWAPFVVLVEELDPGNYTIVLDSGDQSGSSSGLRIEFTVPTQSNSAAVPLQLASAGEQEIVRDLMAFAQGFGPASALPLADEVSLGLGRQFWTVPRSELAAPSAWELDAEFFGGFDGPFNLLDSLARRPFVRVSTGPLPRCPGTALEWPEPISNYQQINIEPVGISSCLAWFGLSIFVDNFGLVRAVSLDLTEP